MRAYEFYLTDLGALLREQAMDARRAARQPNATEYDAGRAMAYYEVISLMQLQAVAFQIPLEKLSLAGIDADRDLL